MISVITIVEDGENRYIPAINNLPLAVLVNNKPQINSFGTFDEAMDCAEKTKNELERLSSE